MTLILTLGNSDQVIQISDRRLSRQGELVDDESNKAGVLVCSNARLAFGFTGIAETASKDFITRDWLLEALNDARSSCTDVLGILRRLRNSASNLFQQHLSLRHLTPKDQILSVMFSGYLDHHFPPRIGCAVVTNDETFTRSEMDSEVVGSFRLLARTWRQASGHEATCVERVGNWRAMAPSDESVLRTMLAERRPAQAIIGTATKLIREMADRPAAANTIGKQLSVVRIPRDRRLSVETQYSTNVDSYESYMPDLVCLTPVGGTLAVKGSVLSSTLPDGAPAVIAVPKVGRNAACPCRSGKKYKKCHGRPMQPPK